MAKKLVTRDQLEALLLAKVKTKPGGEKCGRIGVYRMAEGERSWEVASYDAEATKSAMGAADEEIAREYDLVDEDLEDCARYLHELAKSRPPNVREKIVVCIDGYLAQAPRPSDARAELAAVFRSVPPPTPDNELTEYILEQLDGPPGANG